MMYSWPEGYWAKVNAELSHNFYDTHFERTNWYAREFVPHLKDKTVLEVGGYPGLALQQYLLAGATVSTIDSPSYCPTHYKELMHEWGVEVRQHNIVGTPPAIPDKRWDFAVMSDVLLHVEGHPKQFMAWLGRVAENVILINYTDGRTSAIMEPKSHTLDSGFPVVCNSVLEGDMEGCGKVLFTSKRGHDRDILWFKDANK